MSLLPIVERELRVAARRTSTYVMRLCAGLAVTVLWLVLLMGSEVASPAHLGQHLFNALGVLALGFSMLAGVFLTSDCLSQEKRDGTLGLLFLTDLKGYDVVLGKLAAASVHAFFGLLATFPILGLPLMMGGVSGAEFWRVVLVLSATLFFSLALGILASSISYEAKHSITGAFLLMLLFAGTFPVLWWLQWIFLKTRFFDPLLLPSPGFAYLKALDATYRARGGSAEFLGSLGTILGLGLGCMVSATVILPRVWQQGGTNSAWFGPLRRFRRQEAARKEKRPAIPLQGNPYFWLASRDGSPRKIAWMVLRAITPIWLAFLIGSIVSSKHDPPFATSVFIAYGMHLILKVLIALEASRRVSEDRQSGALELILVSPLTVSEILAGHREALKALFKGPIRLLCLVNLAMMVFVAGSGKTLQMDGKDRAVFCGLFAGGILMLAVDFSALGWVGMWTGLKAKRPHWAAVSALGQIMGIPWVAVFLMVFLDRGPNSATQAALLFSTWFGVGLVVDLFLGTRAKRKLEKEFRFAALQRFGFKET